MEIATLVTLHWSQGNRMQGHFSHPISVIKYMVKCCLVGVCHATETKMKLIHLQMPLEAQMIATKIKME